MANGKPTLVIADVTNDTMRGQMLEWCKTRALTTANSPASSLPRISKSSARHAVSVVSAAAAVRGATAAPPRGGCPGRGGGGPRGGFQEP